MKIRLQEFFELPIRKACIHCRTETQANILLKAFDDMGKRWCTGDSYLSFSNWNRHRENTTYNNGGQYGNIRYAGDNGYMIFEFEDVIFDLDKLKEFIRSLK